jgi:trehalose/maltose hydrolase-like predicted phosphorylase
MPPISPDAVTDYRPGMQPPYVSNGVVGLRFGALPIRDGVCVVSGLAGVHKTDLVEGFARAPLPLACDISVGGAWLSDAPGRARVVEQSYDFSCGELRTRLIFDAGMARVDAEIVTFCSRTMPTLALQQVVLEVDRACELSVRAEISEAGVEGRALTRQVGVPGDEATIDGSLLWETEGALCTCGVAFVSEFLGGPARRTVRADEGSLASTYALRARRGRRYVLRQITAIVPSALHGAPDRQATRLAAAARDVGWESLRTQNARAWDELWKGRIELVGADEHWQALADASFYYLHTSVHASSPSSTGLFGLAFWPDYHYYRGHVMWDLEYFTLPVLGLTEPRAARALLDYRYDRLRAARMNARMWGYRGLQFPWESSIIDGDEAAPGEGTAAPVEHHVSLDVAHAFAQFACTTGDRTFMAERAWPVLEGVAEWISSRVEASQRGFEIRGVCGIAEKDPPVNNNAFTNMGAAVVLQEAAAIGRVLGHLTPQVWDKIAAGLVIPMDAKRTRIISHDGYRADEAKGATPDPLAGFFPFGYETSASVERQTTEFYLDRADAYVGAPMLSALLGVWAARNGNRRRASALFERGYGEFVLEPFTLVDEYSARVFPDMPRAGPFFANIGGFLTGCLFGLTGLRPGLGAPETWCRGPVRMPSLWDGIRVERLWMRGEPVELTATHGDERPGMRRA